MSISSDLGPVREVELSQGTVRYRERGEGPPIVFIHGLLVNGDLWRKVVPQLADQYRCITPDLPLGAHELPLRPDADLTIPGVGRLIVEFCNALGLESPAVIANDTGGAITQHVMTEHPGVIGRVVLTSCDCFDNFLPPMFKPLLWAARVPALLTTLLQPLRIPAMRQLPIAFGWLAKRRLDPIYEDQYVRPLFNDADIRRDCYKVLRDISPRYTQEAAKKLPDFPNPVLVAWSSEDRFFPEEHGRRIAEIVPDGRFRSIDDAYTFSSEDQPDALSKEIASFLEATA